ncbi:hypothetical protein B0H14DRAFT_2632861 [Mycena olivaceomarginata]|nr:hypothetical protein B0H14DRAFT_2632861 [Mycena olivaceomarginata]
MMLAALRFRMPVSLKATFPSPDLPVNFWRSISPALCGSQKRCPAQTDGWFSFDVPNCDLTAGLGLLILSLPTPSFADSRTTATQKWLNGAKSRGNTVLAHAPDGQLDWTRLLDDEWLSGGIIDNMMFDLQTRVAAIPALDASVTVAPLAFQHAIIAFSMQEWPSRYTRSLLKNYKDLVDIGKQNFVFSAPRRWKPLDCVLHRLQEEGIRLRYTLNPRRRRRRRMKEDYEEPEGTSSKKHKSKPPRAHPRSRRRRQQRSRRYSAKKKKKKAGGNRDREGSANGGEGSQEKK